MKMVDTHDDPVLSKVVIRSIPQFEILDTTLSSSNLLDYHNQSGCFIIRCSFKRLFENMSYELFRGPTGITEIFQCLEYDRMTDHAYISACIWSIHQAVCNFIGQKLGLNESSHAQRVIGSQLTSVIICMFESKEFKQSLLEHLVNSNHVMLPDETGLYTISHDEIGDQQVNIIINMKSIMIKYTDQSKTRTCEPIDLVFIFTCSS